MKKALLAVAVCGCEADWIASAFFMIVDHAPASVDFEDASWGGGYAERVGGLWRVAVPLRGQEARAVLKSRQGFRGGYFEVKMKTVSSRVGGSAFYLYAENEPDDFEEIDVEVYGFMENVSDVYVNLNPATADFTCAAIFLSMLLKAGLKILFSDMSATAWVGELPFFTSSATNLENEGRAEWLCSLKGELDRLILENHIEHIESINSQIKKTDEAIRERASRDEDVRLLLSLTGIDMYTALLIRSEIGQQGFPD
jgi:hypothetical protein